MPSLIIQIPLIYLLTFMPISRSSHIFVTLFPEKQKTAKTSLAVFHF